MPEIELRPVDQQDIDSLTAIEHGYYSEFVWQVTMEPIPKTCRLVCGGPIYRGGFSYLIPEVKRLFLGS